MYFLFKLVSYGVLLREVAELEGLFLLIKSPSSECGAPTGLHQHLQSTVSLHTSTNCWAMSRFSEISKEIASNSVQYLKVEVNS